MTHTTDLKCSTEGCTAKRRARGMCQKHYDQHRRSQPAPPCKVVGCAKQSATRGMCSMHYARWRKYGDTETVALVHNDPDRRFREFYEEQENGCWEWQGHIESNGYARFTVGDDRTGAHRWAYERYIGEIPEGLVIDHLCRNRACVNPGHLEPVTARENLLRGDTYAARNFKKTHCKRGHPFAGANLIFNTSGHRQCRECRNMRARKRARLISQNRTK